MSTNTDTLIAHGTLTTECTCEDYNHNTGCTPAPHCYGDCWDIQLQTLEDNITHLMQASNGWWNINNMPAYNNRVSGYFHAQQTHDLAAHMGPRGQWRARWEVFPDRIEYVLTHHDCPTGMTVVLAPMTGLAPHREP